LFDKLEVAGLQSYILDEQRKYFLSNERMDGPGNYKEKLAEWNLRFYYPCMRQYLLQVSFDEKRFYHRMQEGIFLPLIPPQSIATASERTEAFQSLKGMSADLLLEFDRLLWEGLQERTGWNGYGDASQKS